MDKRKNYISLINVLSCIAVVYLHTNECFWNFSKESYWISANIFECLFYFAVPCFFMIAGSTLIDFNERYSLKEYFKRRIRKTLLPYLFWSLFALIIYLFVLKTISLDDLSIKYILNGILNSEFVNIYWFFPSLFSVYLSIPLFSGIAKEKRSKIFTYLVECGLVVNCLIPLIIELIDFGKEFPISLIVAEGNIIYILIGYLLSNNELPKKARKGIYYVSFCAFLIHCIGTMILSYRAGYVVRTLKGYTNILAIIYSAGIFLYVKENSDLIMKKHLVQKTVMFLSDYTFAIYLLQFFIYNSFIYLFGIDTKSLIYRLGFPPVLIVIAVITTWILRKIPLLRNTVPK